MKDAVATMGMILPDDVGGRDAVHVAVISATSKHTLWPGDRVSCEKDPSSGDVIVSRTDDDPIGIVDPFLTKLLQPGMRFWVYLMPRTITSLRHNWTHPQFEDVKEQYYTPATKLQAEQWLKDFCERSGCPPYEQMIEILQKFANGVIKESFVDRDEDYYGWVIDSDYFHFNGTDAHGEIPPEFWVMAEIVVGKPFKYKPDYFSCSC